MRSGTSKLVDGILLLLLMAVGAWIRVDLISATNGVIDADEAIVGLMGKHMLEGREWPIFYYGQHYMGSLEPTLAALSFWLFGISNWSLKLVPLVFSVVLIPLVYSLTLRFASNRGALVAALATAIPPSALIIWSGMARGGFIELVVIGTLALILTVDLLAKSTHQPGRAIVLGWLIGLGWWVNNQIIFYLVPIGLLAAVHYFKSFGVTSALRRALWAFAGFAVGSAPFWYYNLVQTPRFRSFEIFRSSGGGHFWQYLAGFFDQALPIIFGARRFWSDTDMFPGSALAAYLLYASFGFGALLLWRQSRTRQSVRYSGPALLVLFCLTVPLVFASSSFGWLSSAPRYLLPLYSVIFVFLGVSVDRLWQLRGILGRGLGIGLVLAVVGLNLASNYGYGGAAPGQPFVFGGQRVALNHAPLYDWLEREGYTQVRTNYWIGYRIAFETKERVIFSHFRGPGVVRIPEYQSCCADEQFAPLVLVPAEADAIGSALTTMGRSYRRSEVGEYSVIDQISEWEAHGSRVLPARILASSMAERAANLMDGDPGTRWGSGQPQSPGMNLVAEFDSPVALAALELDLGFWLTDFPRDIVIEAELAGEGGKRCVLLDTRGNGSVHYLLKGERLWHLTFPSSVVRAIRISQVGSHPLFDWSLAEVSFFGPPSGDPDEGERFKGLQ